MILLGYIAAILIGLSLGLIGGGGSILTVPVLVYLFHIAPLPATSYSLFIVGLTSLVGAYSNLKEHQVSISTALWFGAASVITVLITRRFLIPAIPDTLFFAGSFAITKSFAIMVLFAILMLFASISMIKPDKATVPQARNNYEKKHHIQLIIYGLLIGLVTGVLGAGGGFLLIPALVLLVKLPMKKAIGTSLFIIAINSLIGFLGDAGHYPIHWPLLLSISILAIVAVLAGNVLKRKIDGSRLKKGFGWFVLIMGIYIITRELFM